jgi:hypothetical protein
MRNYQIQFNESNIKNLCPNDLKHLNKLLKSLERIHMKEEEKCPISNRIISEENDLGSLVSKPSSVSGSGGWSYSL